MVWCVGLLWRRLGGGACPGHNARSEDRASGRREDCCGGSRWVSGMLARRPFRSRALVLSAADEVLGSLDPRDWQEAFAHHPRIGERKGATTWASAEQAGACRAVSAGSSALVETNREYEQRFGYIYIVCATGKTGEEMLAIAQQRLTNAPEDELRVAAEEQRKITHLRLMKLVS